MTDAETPRNFGRWVRAQLERAGVPESQLAFLSGIPADDLARILSGEKALDQDNVQRIATILAELRVLPEAAVVWEAAGYPPSPYINDPESIVRAVSGHPPGENA